MKQLILLNCLLSFTFFNTFNTTYFVENMPATLLSLPSPYPSFIFSTKQQYDQEGFCGNTLVQTPYGYKSIKNLVKDDVVVDYNGQEKRIVAITKHYVNRYIKLIVDDISIYTGCDQLYYVFPDSRCVAAQDIKAADLLLNNANESCLVTCAELIHENILLYYLTVEGHTFSIAPYGLCVHNAQALVVGVSSVCLGHVTMINPIVAMIGATIALSVIAHKAYQAYIQKCTENDETIALPTGVLLAERLYYVQRFMDLEAIKQELFYIKNGLEGIKALCYPDSGSFTYQFLKQTNTQNIHHQNQLLKISAEYEMQLSDKQKENLRVLREIELESLEQEVVALQCVLALHVDELIKQIDSAGDEYKETQEQTSRTVTLWNNNCSNMTYTIAVQSYKAILLQEDLLNNFDQKLSELKIVAQYYTNCANAICVEQSTNIIELLEKLGPVIIEYDQWVATEKSRIAKNINVVEEHFIGRGIAAPNLKNGIKNELAKGRKNINGQVVDEAKNKLVSIAVSGGPNKYPKKDDDDNDDKERKKNTLTKSEFFKKVKDNYEHYRDGIYRRKRNAEGVENAEYLQWDHLHGDVEAYSKSRVHIGSIDPEKLTLYKGPVYGRDFPLT